MIQSHRTLPLPVTLLYLCPPTLQGVVPQTPFDLTNPSAMWLKPKCVLTSNTDDRLTAGEISDVDEGVVEAGEDAVETKEKVDACQRLCHQMSMCPSDSQFAV